MTLEIILKNTSLHSTHINYSPFEKATINKFILTYIYFINKNKPMRIVLLVFLLGFSNISFAQLREGFDPDEAKSLIAVCNSFTFLELYDSDTLIIPEDYRKIFTSEVIGLDNMFQVYKSDKLGVINFRGSTTKTSSWVENFYSAMIPAEGVIKINKKDCPYKFAKDTVAAVHSGYALAVTLLGPIIIDQINKLNTNGIYHIFITGHSQGGSLAHLVRAYLENLSDGEISPKNVFKTYTFANPMCGNEEFANEYNISYSEINMSYSIINPADLVPKMPMHFQEEGKPLSNFNFMNWANGIEKIEVKEILGFIFKKFEPALTGYIYSSNRLIEKLISASYMSIDLPNYVHDINYFQTGTIRELEPFPNPKIPIDTLNMTKKEIAQLEQDKDGNYYENKSNFFQHKPYNYYVAILREYFSKDYRELEFTYLPENLE